MVYLPATARPSPAWTARRVTGTWSGWRLVAVGAASGLVWGVAARAWMRYISPDPQFTWAGTLIILGLATIAGAALATVEALRRRGSRAWRLLFAVPALLLMAGAGALLAPAAFCGGFALAHRGPRWARILAGVLACAPVGVLLGTEPVIAGSLTVVVAGLVLLCLPLALAWSAVFRRRPGTVSRA